MKASKLAALAQENSGITPLGLDVTTESATKQIAAGVKRKIDILACNAGVLIGYGCLKDKAHQSWAIESVLLTNIAGVFSTVRFFLPHLLENNEKSGSNLTHTGKLQLSPQLFEVRH